MKIEMDDNTKQVLIVLACCAAGVLIALFSN